MRIAGLARRLGKPGGAEESMFTLFNKLRQNYTTQIYGHADTDTEREKTSTVRIFSESLDLKNIFRVPLSYTESYLRFRQKLYSFEPDIIFSQHELALLGAEHPAPQILFLRDGSLLPSSLPETIFGKNLLNFLTVRTQRVLFNYIISNSDLVIANSEHTAKKYSRVYDISPKVVYPFVDTSRYIVSNTGDSILHVNPSDHKGINVTLEICTRIPDRNFIVVGTNPSESVKEKMESLPNLEYYGYVDDMRRVYRKTGLVLMPTTVEEPFGRIPIEAGVSGIPTIGSNKGGLPESIGTEDLIVDSSDPQKYIQAIESVYENYDEISRLVIDNAEAKSADKQFKYLENLIQESLGKDIIIN